MEVTKLEVGEPSIKLSPVNLDDNEDQDDDDTW